MKEENKRYYSKKGKRIYSDFLTFASADSALAKCTAREFLDKFGAGKGRLDIVEFGVGNGNFAKNFILFLEKNAPKLEFTYSLFDISGKMLEDARKNLGKLAGKCKFIRFDAHKDSLASFRFDFVILDELLCDLETEVYKEGDRINDKEKEKTVSAFLARVEKGRKIPFNFSACEFLGKVLGSLKAGGTIHVFDYGFYSFDDVKDVEVEVWNDSLCRKYGSQVTCDLNFPLLMAEMGARKGKPMIETQRKFVERKLGYPVRVEERKNGLFYLKAGKERIDEEDGFYHLEIQKKS